MRAAPFHRTVLRPLSAPFLIGAPSTCSTPSWCESDHRPSARPIRRSARYSRKGAPPSDVRGRSEENVAWARSTHPPTSVERCQSAHVPTHRALPADVWPSTCRSSPGQQAAVGAALGRVFRTTTWGRLSAARWGFEAEGSRPAVSLRSVEQSAGRAARCCWARGDPRETRQRCPSVAQCGLARLDLRW
jgi:hypothetical protein